MANNDQFQILQGQITTLHSDIYNFMRDTQNNLKGMNTEFQNAVNQINYNQAVIDSKLIGLINLLEKEILISSEVINKYCLDAFEHHPVIQHFKAQEKANGMRNVVNQTKKIIMPGGPNRN